eukprot:superscaffoldBa00010111_g24514
MYTDDLLGKRRSLSPNSSSECPSDSKKSRSVSPKENSQSPVVEAGGSHSHMSPEEHYRRMMSALSEQGSYEEQQQRLYQLASSMGLPGHADGCRLLCTCQSTKSIMRPAKLYQLGTPLHSHAEENRA